MCICQIRVFYLFGRYIPARGHFRFFQTFYFFFNNCSFSARLITTGESASIGINRECLFAHHCTISTGSVGFVCWVISIERFSLKISYFVRKNKLLADGYPPVFSRNSRFWRPLLILLCRMYLFKRIQMILNDLTGEFFIFWFSAMIFAGMFSGVKYLHLWIRLIFLQPAP